MDHTLFLTRLDKDLDYNIFFELASYLKSYRNGCVSTIEKDKYTDSFEHYIGININKGQFFVCIDVRFDNKLTEKNKKIKEVLLFLQFSEGFDVNVMLDIYKKARLC